MARPEGSLVPEPFGHELIYGDVLGLSAADLADLRRLSVAAGGHGEVPRPR